MVKSTLGAGWFGAIFAMGAKALGLLSPILALVAGDGRLYIALGTMGLSLTDYVPWLTTQMAIAMAGGAATLVILAQIWKRYVKPTQS